MVEPLLHTIALQDAQVLIGLVEADLYAATNRALAAGDFEMAWACRGALDGYRRITDRLCGRAARGAGTGDVGAT